MATYLDQISAFCSFPTLAVERTHCCLALRADRSRLHAGLGTAATYGRLFPILHVELSFYFFSRSLSFYFLRANKQWSEREMSLRATAACRARTLVAELRLPQGAEEGGREGGSGE